MWDLKLIYFEFFIDCINILLSLIIFINIKQIHKKSVILPINIVLLFLMDIQYLIVYYFNIKNGFILYECITYSWYTITIISLFNLLIKFVYGRKEIYLLFASFLFVALVIVFFFSPNFLKYLHHPYYSLELSSHITIFYLCILLIIGTQNKYVLSAICGLCIAEIGNFAMTECYLQNNQSSLVYGEFGWFIGIFILAIGMLNIVRFKVYNVKLWFFNSTTIRNKFSFLIFTISIWSFIIACIVMKKFSKINDNTLVFIPAIGMFYSMITAAFSIIISKQMEKPFKLIQAKIGSLFKGNSSNIDQEFNLIEFQKLNNFIVESYEYKTYLEKHIISMATRIAHDIKSPLQIIENLTKNPEVEHYQEQLIKQINKINYISKSLLTENKKFINSDLTSIQCLYSIISDLISDKQIEWDTDSSIISFDYLPNKIIWLSDKQSNIKTIISNLLNNAFEASDNTYKIELVIDITDNKIIICIEDYGCGIAKDNLNDVLNGKSFKANGNGIGLSTALKFMTSIDGKLIIDTEVNKGTKIKLIFPILTFPAQFALQINIKTKSVIIVDDNYMIINFWQEYFLFNSEKHNIKYFLNFASLREFLLNQSSDPDCTYLLDYNILGEKCTGVDMIKEFNLINSYLVTNYAEDIKLQDEIKSLSLKLIPKVVLQLESKIIYNT